MRYWLMITVVVLLWNLQLEEAFAAPKAWPMNGPKLEFSGYRWQVKNGYDYPGKNYWAPDNAWVDEQDQLHLRLRQQSGRWYCCEIRSEQFFHYGRFRFEVIGDPETLNPQIVIGLFLYNELTQNELDVEFSRWGNPGNRNGLYSVYQKGVQKGNISFPARLPDGDYSTHQIRWQRDKVDFFSQYGHRNDESLIFSRWTYSFDQEERYQFAMPMRIHMNIWLYQGGPMFNAQKETEFVIRNFSYFSE